MAYHVVSPEGVVYETDDLQGARNVRNAIKGELTIDDGPVEFLRLKAQKKFGQKPNHYASAIGQSINTSSTRVCTSEPV